MVAGSEGEAVEYAVASNVEGGEGISSTATLVGIDGSDCPVLPEEVQSILFLLHNVLLTININKQSKH